MPNSHEDKNECQIWGIAKLLCNNLWKKPTEVRRAYRNSSESFLAAISRQK